MNECNFANYCNGGLFDGQDVRITASKLRAGVLKGMIRVKDKLFNHIDFILAKDADKLIYNRILREMRKFK